MNTVSSYLQAIKQSSKYEFSSVQLNLPVKEAAIVRQMASQINSQDLIRREHVPHITIKYGLHASEPTSVRTILSGNGYLRVKFGRTEVLSGSSEGDVIVVKVLSPDLRKAHANLIRDLPHTMMHPKYHPHVIVAHVKKGRGHKYVGIADLEGKELMFSTALFSSRSGKQTEINLKAASTEPFSLSKYLRRASGRVPFQLGVGGVGGALIGRYALAPVLSKLFRLNPDKARAVFTALGLGAGLTPGLLTGAIRKQRYGSFFHPSGGPRNYAEVLRDSGVTMGESRFSRVGPFIDLRSRPSTDLYDLNSQYIHRKSILPKFLRKILTGRAGSADIPADSSVKSSAFINNPYVYNEALWRPSFPVSQSMDDLSRNPHPGLFERIKMRQLIAQAGQQQGVGRTGLASAGSLLAALPRVIENAIPTVGGALAVSKLLGAPTSLKRTAIGGALIYSVLRGFMNKRGSLDAPVGYYLKTTKEPNGIKDMMRYRLARKGKNVAYMTTSPGKDSKVISGLMVRKPHRGKGLARYLLSVAGDDNKGSAVSLQASSFSDKPISNVGLTKFYESAGFKSSGNGWLKKKAFVFDGKNRSALQPLPVDKYPSKLPGSHVLVGTVFPLAEIRNTVIADKLKGQSYATMTRDA